jgi:hypothetical protein
MGIESLNSAATAAGFAMVSDDESVDGTMVAYESSAHSGGGVQSTEPALASRLDSQLPAVIEAGGRSLASAAALGARVTGLLESWRSKG